jgi:hypothetical protein
VNSDGSMTQTYVYRHYRTGKNFDGKDSRWCSYRVVHKQDDSGIADVRLPDEMLAGLRDGDEFELTLRPTGHKLTTRWELQVPHTYGATDNPMSAGCPECQAAFPITPAPDKGDT